MTFLSVDAGSTSEQLFPLNPKVPLESPGLDVQVAGEAGGNPDRSSLSVRERKPLMSGAPPRALEKHESMLRKAGTGGRSMIQPRIPTDEAIRRLARRRRAAETG